MNAGVIYVRLILIFCQSLVSLKKYPFKRVYLIDLCVFRVSDNSNRNMNQPIRWRVCLFKNKEKLNYP